MKDKILHRTVEVKLYLKPAQAETLAGWMRTCARIYNLALENRIKRYERRGERTSLYGQCELLTKLRSGIPAFEDVPSRFTRDALRRLDRSFSAFFRRVELGQKAGFPRFRATRRWHSMERTEKGRYIRSGNRLAIPKLGLVKFRAGKDRGIPREQFALRIVRRASGWYAQLAFEDGVAPAKVEIKSAAGIDVGLEHFATLSTGEHVPNPRFFRGSSARLRKAQRELTRKRKGSANRTKAVFAVALIHETIAAQRRDFAHQLSRRLVNEFDLIAFEDLNVKGLTAGMLAKSVHDAAWGILFNQLRYKAESAGKHTVEPDSRGTSQECPDCGRIRKKELSERWHRCECGCVCQRDHASAQVILARGLRVVGPAVEGSTAVLTHRAPRQVGPAKQKALL